MRRRYLFGQWLFALAAPGILGFAQGTGGSEEEVRVGKIFAARVQQYLKLHKDVEATLPALKPTNDAARIADHQHALARKIKQARSGARQGDVFTEPVTRHLRRVIRGEFQGPDGALARKTILPDEPSRIVRLHVNEVYPEDIPLITMPPTLLIKLPPLPQELAYRIVGHDLTLKDTKAGLIVDLIPNVIP